MTYPRYMYYFAPAVFMILSAILPPAIWAQGKIAFTSNRDGNNEIYVMNSDGTDQNRLTVNTVADSRPSFSPGGAKIAFDSDRDGNLLNEGSPVAAVRNGSVTVRR